MPLLTKVTAEVAVGMPDKPALSVKVPAGATPAVIVLIVAVPKPVTLMELPTAKPVADVTVIEVAEVALTIVVGVPDAPCPNCTWSMRIAVCAWFPSLATMFITKVYVTTAAATLIAMSSNVAMIGLTARTFILRFLRFFIVIFFLLCFVLCWFHIRGVDL